MLIFDLETDGLLNDATKIHCFASTTLTLKKRWSLMINRLRQLQRDQRRNLSSAVSNTSKTLIVLSVITLLIMTLAIITKFYPWFRRIGDCLDTLLLSRLYHPNLIEIDKQKTWKVCHSNFMESHSLAAWGYRLNEAKGDYCKDADWQEWSPEMEDYMIQDVTVTRKLWNHFRPYLNGSR